MLDPTAWLDKLRSKLAVRAGRGPVLLAVMAAFVLLGYLFVLIEQRGRALEHDEAQHLHMAWMQAEGLRPFLDYADNHPPLLHALLRWLVPGRTTPLFPLLDVPAFAARARAVSALFGTVATVAATFLTFRATRSMASTVFMATLLSGTEPYWFRGIAEIRPEPLALMFLFGGVLLVSLRWERALHAGVAKGAGVGLSFLALLANAKWPLIAAALGLFSLGDLARLPREKARAFVAAIASFAFACALGLGLAALSGGVSRFVENVLAYNLLTRDAAASIVAGDATISTPFKYCPSCYKPLVVVSALALGALLVARDWPRWKADPRRRVVALVLCLVAASFFEVRFLYAKAWAQYYMAWTVLVAVVYAVVFQIARETAAAPRGASRLWSAELVTVLPLVAAFVLYAEFVIDLRRNPADDAVRWEWISYAQQHLSPGDRVWVRADVHPIGARDASFYWTAVADQVPVSLAYAAGHPDETILPHLTEADLPPCRAASGAFDVRLITVEYNDLTNLPETLACLHRLSDEGRLCPTPFPSKYALVARPGAGCEAD